MPAFLQITKKLAVTPLFDIESDTFADTYRNGLWWSLYGECEGEKPLPDSYLADNLKRDANKGLLIGQQDDLLYHVGFYFGMVHGGILCPRTGQQRPDVTALATFTHPNARRGYSVARRDHFYYADITYVRTESALLQTDEEWQQWEAEHRELQAKMRCDMAQMRDTEPLDLVPVVEYTP